jgi:hypothetical protein
MQNVLSENENEVWPQIAPLLDAAMAGLSETDRHAVVLRFFDGKSIKEVGAALGASEDAAKMRLNRAVEKLRGFFTRRGVVIPAATLTAAISANSVQAAPACLAAAITGKALATTTTVTLTQAIIMTTLQKTMVIAAVGLLAGAGIYEAVQLAQKHQATQSSATANPEPPNSTETYVARAQYAFAGYATPEAAIKSIFWLQSQGDVEASLDSLSPKIRSLLEKELKSVPERNVSGSMIKEDKNILGYSITNHEKVSDDKIVITVSVNDVRPQHGEKKMQLVRINSEWKYDGVPDQPKK